MSLDFTLELQPRSRLDVIDVRQSIRDEYGDALDEYPRCVYCSFHTTAGYLEQSLASRLATPEPRIRHFIDLFRAFFPEDAGYQHDQLELRDDLSSAQRLVEPRNADSHLAFLAAGLHACVSYVNRPGPVYLIDLDGVHAAGARRRITTSIGFNEEIEVAHRRISIPVSAHPVDSINLKDPALGLYQELSELIAHYEIPRGRIRVELAGGERHAGLTVNEYETLLMRHDLFEVLRNPLRFAAEKARHALADPGAVPLRTLDYAKYDFVRVFNQVLDTFGLNDSFIERVISRAMAVPADRFLRMKRSINLLVSDHDRAGQGAIVEGTYQSPILVQWNRAPGGVRQVDVTLTRFI
jgi:hypothetical protein